MEVLFVQEEKTIFAAGLAGPRTSAAWNAFTSSFKRQPTAKRTLS